MKRSLWFLIPICIVVAWCVGFVVAHGQGTARYNQGPFTVTTAAVMRPFTCANNGTCAGTPTWAGDANVNFCNFTVVGGSLNWSASGATPVTGANPTTGQQWAPGIWTVLTRPGAPNANLQRFRMIGATGNVNVTMECGY